MLLVPPKFSILDAKNIRPFLSFVRKSISDIDKQLFASSNKDEVERLAAERLAMAKLVILAKIELAKIAPQQKTKNEKHCLVPIFDLEQTQKVIKRALKFAGERIKSGGDAVKAQVENLAKRLIAEGLLMQRMILNDEYFGCRELIVDANKVVASGLSWMLNDNAALLRRISAPDTSSQLLGTLAMRKMNDLVGFAKQPSAAKDFS